MMNLTDWLLVGLFGLVMSLLCAMYAAYVFSFCKDSDDE